jgi:hypothetical protein
MFVTAAAASAVAQRAAKRPHHVKRVSVWHTCRQRKAVVARRARSRARATQILGQLKSAWQARAVLHTGPLKHVVSVFVMEKRHDISRTCRLLVARVKRRAAAPAPAHELRIHSSRSARQACTQVMNSCRCRCRCAVEPPTSTLGMKTSPTTELSRRGALLAFLLVNRPSTSCAVLSPVSARDRQRSARLHQPLSIPASLPTHPLCSSPVHNPFTAVHNPFTAGPPHPTVTQWSTRRRHRAGYDTPRAAAATGPCCGGRTTRKDHSHGSRADRSSTPLAAPPPSLPPGEAEAETEAEAPADADANATDGEHSRFASRPLRAPPLPFELRRAETPSSRGALGLWWLARAPPGGVSELGSGEPCEKAKTSSDAELLPAPSTGGATRRGGGAASGVGGAGGCWKACGDAVTGGTAVDVTAAATFAAGAAGGEGVAMVEVGCGVGAGCGAGLRGIKPRVVMSGSQTASLPAL